jgi:hypothetical protein
VGNCVTLLAERVTGRLAFEVHEGEQTPDRTAYPPLSFRVGRVTDRVRFCHAGLHFVGGRWAFSFGAGWIRMQTLNHRLRVGMFILLMSVPCLAQDVYSVAIYSAGTSHRQHCSVLLPFPPYHFKMTERIRYEDPNGLVIMGIGREKAREGVLHRYLDVEIGSESFTILLEPKHDRPFLPNQTVEATAPPAFRFVPHDSYNIIIPGEPALPGAVPHLGRWPEYTL